MMRDNMLSVKTISNLDKLAKLLTENKKSGEIPEWPFICGRIPDDINVDRTNGDTLYLCGELYKTYGFCLTSLVNEKQLEYLSQRSINKELWYFTCQIFFKPDTSKKTTSIQQAIEYLEKRLVKPLEEWEIIIPIENLKLGGREYIINGVKLFEMSPELTEQWGINKENAIDEINYKQIIGKVVAIFIENAADSDKAIEIAKNKVSTLLDILRVSLLIDHQPLIIDWVIHDEELLFTNGECAFARKKVNKESYFSQTRSFRGVDFTLKEDHYKQLDNSKQILENMFDNLSRSLVTRFVRAIHWISNSITSEEFDYKVVDICTSLETMLTSKGDPRKGECIALRIQLLNMILQKSTIHPKYILEIYDKRSNVIHGSSLKICSKTDYNIGKRIALDTLVKSLEYIKINKITKHEDFLNSLLGDNKLLHKAIVFWKSTKYSKSVNKAAVLMFDKKTI
jgi:hypothetical protein